MYFLALPSLLHSTIYLIILVYFIVVVEWLFESKLIFRPIEEEELNASEDVEDGEEVVDGTTLSSEESDDDDD